MDFYHREILDKFMHNTGARAEFARDILNRCNWDYQTALQMYMPMTSQAHSPRAQTNSYGYTPTAQVHNVPIIYVGSGSGSAHTSERPLQVPLQVNSSKYGGGVGAGGGRGYGIVKPMGGGNIGYAGSSTVRSVPIGGQVVHHVVTTPTVTKPTPTSTHNSTTSHTQGDFIIPHTTSRDPATELPVAVEVPVKHFTADTCSHPASQPPPVNTGYITVTPVHAPTSKPSPVPNHQQKAHVQGGSGPHQRDVTAPFKAPLQRSDATEIDPDGNSRILKRGISKTSDNLLLVNRARDVVLHDIRESSEDHTQFFVETPELTFILPDLTTYSEDFRGFLEKDLIETSTLISLEQAGCLNWWADYGISQRLHPMATTGDGNCLLHAASLAMWGFHDRDLILRKALYNSMTSGAFHGALFRQWRYQQTQVNKQTGLIYSEEEWKREWENLLRLASTQPRRIEEHIARENSCCDSPVTQGTKAACKHSTVVYESLEEFHVFVLAHVLRRPVIVVADKVLRDTNGDALAPIPFGGIYLPIRCKPQNCHRTPLLLTYDAAHFSALVPMEKDISPEEQPNLPVAMPVVDCNYELLPLHFVVDPGEDFDWESLVRSEGPSLLDLTLDKRLDLLERYMDMKKLPFTKPDGDNDSDGRSSGSVESDESIGSGGGKDKRKDTKLQQQMHSVSKQFGSLGRSMGKKFKKNFGNIGKTMKGMVPEKNGINSSKNPTILSGVTQSTKLTVSVPMMFDQDQLILCAKLSTHRSEIQQQLVKNYLTEAEKRFQVDHELKRKKGVELRNRVSTGEKEKEGDCDLSKIPSKCVTPGCSMYGTASSSYLCSDCFARSKKQAIDHLRHPPPFTYNTYPGPRTQAQPLSTTDPLYRMECGKSRFYAPVAEEEKTELREPTKNFLNPTNNVPVITRPMSAGVAETRSVNAGNMSVCRPLASINRASEVNTSLPSLTGHTARTPSPDCHYDNVEYGMKASQFSSDERRQCRVLDCLFFGSEATNWYCSKCFREREKSQLTPHDNTKHRL